MKRILILMFVFALLFTACAEEEPETPAAAGPASVSAGTEIFSDAACTSSAGVLSARLVVYITSILDGQIAEIRYLQEGTLRTGYVKASGVSFLSEQQIEAYVTGITEPDGSYGGLPLLNAVFNREEEPDEPDRPERPKRKKQARITGEERGTPGVYTHVQGSFEMDIYWGVNTEKCETREGALLLGGETVGIAGTDLSACVEGERLILTGESFTVSGEALLTLRESGITAVDAGGFILPTDSFLSGEVYASLRSSGIGDRRIDYVIGASSVTAEALGETYSVCADEKTGLWILERSGA